MEKHLVRINLPKYIYFVFGFNKLILPLLGTWQHSINLKSGNSLSPGPTSYAFLSNHKTTIEAHSSKHSLSQISFFELYMHG